MESSEEIFRVRCRRFTVEFKRQVVEAALSPGASVARIACEHQLNANLLFKWCGQYKRGLLGAVAGDERPLLPVALIPAAPAESGCSELLPGRIELRIGRIHLHIQGRVDSQTLQTVLRRVVR